MRVKEMKYKILSSPMYDRMKKVDQLPWAKNLFKNYFYPYPGSNYTRSAYHWLMERWYNQIPMFRKRVEINIGYFVIEAWINIKVEEYQYKGIESCVWFNLRNTPLREMQKDTFDLPDNLDLNNPEQELKKMLLPYLFDGQNVMSFIQYHWKCEKRYVKIYYPRIKKQIMIEDDGFEDLVNWTQRHYKLDCSALSYHEQIRKAIQKYGKQKELHTVYEYDFREISSFLDDFDGDVDELEHEYLETLNDLGYNNPLNLYI